MERTVGSGDEQAKDCATLGDAGIWLGTLEALWAAVSAKTSILLCARNLQASVNRVTLDSTLVQASAMTDSVSPPSVETALRLLRCPACFGRFARRWECQDCGHCYEEALGIPDLRWPPERDPPAVIRQTQALLDAYPTYSLEKLRDLRGATLALDPRIDSIRQQYRASHVERGARMARMLLRRLELLGSLPARAVALDLGCGTGGAALSMSARFETVIALDQKLADLLILRKSLDEQGQDNILLVQGSLHRLPLAAECVDCALAVNVIEHMLDVRTAFAELARSLRSLGIFCGDSRNRFDPFFPEPHVQLRLVGYLPRSLAARYVHWRSGLTYEGTRLLSYFELKRELDSAFARSAIVLPELAAYRPARPSLDAPLDWIQKHLPALARGVMPVFPTLIAIGQKA